LKAYLELDSSSRPIWAYIADALLRKCTPKSAKIPDEPGNIPYIQNWQPTSRNLPLSLKSMVKAAKKYSLDYNLLKPSQAIQMNMPLWHHIGEKKDMTQYNNSPTCKCLRQNHQVFEVKDAIAIIGRLDHPTHENHDKCLCTDCLNDRLYSKCKNPHQCATMAARKLNSLQEKWDPQRSTTNEHLDQINLEEGDILFDSRLDAHCLSEGFHVFTAPTTNKCTTPKPIQEHAAPVNDGPETFSTIWCAGKCKGAKSDEATATAGIWLSPGNRLNKSIALPSTLRQSSPTAEAVAVLSA
ncbi:hypothetical protein BDP27DRAFT_1148676, partial [Rhodocollybia butyracea]